MFGNIYAHRRVLLTGHTGFKGSHLALWLEKLGAEILGVSLKPGTNPSHFELLGGERRFRSVFQDIRDSGKLEKIFGEFRPEIVFHLAAQPIVLESYRDPVGTFDTNVMGTVKVLEACRKTPSVRAVVAVTTDKCYENSGDGIPKKENDPMGGCDPYSASKGCAELAVASYRDGFFNFPDSPALATARAGNVIGGGDWASNRLVPDLMRAAEEGRIEHLRNPDSVRPWQHVLEPLSGYLLLGEKLFSTGKAFAEGWNFGPDFKETLSVSDAARELSFYWNKIRFDVGNAPKNALKEAEFLTLDSSKAAEKLFWRPVRDVHAALKATADWHRVFAETGKTQSVQDLETYCAEARAKELPWAIR